MDLSLVDIEDLFVELRRRFFACVFVGELRHGDDGETFTEHTVLVRREEGSHAHCMGLIEFLRQKNMVVSDDTIKRFCDD